MGHPSLKQWPSICLKELYNSHRKKKPTNSLSWHLIILQIHHAPCLLAPHKQINHLYLKLYFHVMCRTYIQVSLPCSMWHDACLNSNLSQHYTRQTVSWILPHAECIKPSTTCKAGHHRTSQKHKFCSMHTQSSKKTTCSECGSILSHLKTNAREPHMKPKQEALNSCRKNWQTPFNQETMNTAPYLNQPKKKWYTKK